MANALYPKFKSNLMMAGIDLLAVDMRIALLNQSSYIYSAAHEFVSQLSGIVGRTNLLTGPVVDFDTATFITDDPTAQSVTGSDIYRLVLYIDKGSDAESTLVMFQDTGVTTVPFSPDGSDIRILSPDGWFVL